MRRLRLRSVKSRALLFMPGVLFLTGCSRSPSFNVLGSYFPAWLLCMLFAIGATAALHTFVKRMQWSQRVPALPLLYVSVAVLIASSLWLIAFE